MLLHAPGANSASLAEQGSAAKGPNSLEVRDLSFRYRNRRDWALRSLNFSIQAGSLCVVTGPSGSGKTTLFRLLAGLFASSEGQFEGSVSIDAIQYCASKVGTVPSKIGILLQDPTRQLHQSTVLDELLSGPQYHGYEWGECLARARASGNLLFDENLFSRSPYDLSLGEQQKVALAALLAVDFPILLLDEPFSSLDYPAICKLKETLKNIKSLGKTILVSSHDVLALGNLADFMVVLDRGAIVLQGLPMVVLQSDTFEKVVGRPLSLSLSLAVKEMAPTRQTPIGWDELSETVCLVNTTCHETLPEVSAAEASATLSLENVSLGGDASRIILRGVNLELSAGRVCALLGANGAGKSSLLQAILRVRPILSGLVKVLGQSIDKISPSEFASKVGFISQNPTDMLFETNCLREVAFGLLLQGKENAIDIAECALQEVGLADHILRHPRSLSVGQQRLLTLAIAIANNSSVLLLDEPEHGLDAKTWEEVCRALGHRVDQGTSILIATHHMETVLRFKAQVTMLIDGTAAVFETFDQLISASIRAKEELGLAADQFDLLARCFRLKRNADSEEQFAKLLKRDLCFR